MTRKPASGQKQQQGRPRTLKQGYRVVAVSLDPPDLEWIDSLVSTMKASGTVGEGPTRSSVVRLAVRRMIEEYEGLDIENLMSRFLVARVEVPEGRTK
jgi:Arc/MetJ-type ribon-helix-helix transcriptional regulator